MRDREDISISHENSKKEKDVKEKEKFMCDKERDQERERYRKLDHRYRENERASPRSISKQDQGNRGRQRDHRSKREYHYETSSKKYCRSDWNQLPHRQITRPSQSPPNSIIHIEHVASLNYHPRRRSRSPDRRV